MASPVQPQTTSSNSRASPLNVLAADMSEGMA